MTDKTAGAAATEGSDAARQRAATLVGRTLSDRYRIVSLIAMGGMGAIYRAEHLLMRKQIALKVLHPEIEGFPELVARFEREAVAGAHVQHPNVATASDFGKFDGGSAFLVLEYIQGITVRELIDRGPIPPARAASITRQVAAALSAIHQKGIVHRDIKPKNIMIVEQPQPGERDSGKELGGGDVVKLIDFGLAKVPVEELSAIALDADNPRRSLTAAGVVMGTLGYLAPEAALGTRSILPPADLYALGVVFYEMLCGKPPFEGTDASLVFFHHRTSPVPPLRERNPDADVPPAFETIVRRMLEKDPDDRYESAAALVAALDEALATVAGDIARPQGAAPTPSAVAPVSANAATTGTARRSAVWLGGALAAIATLALVAVLAGIKPPALMATGSTGESSASVAPFVEPPPRPPPPPRAPGALERLRAASDDEPGAAITALVALADAEPQAFADRAVQSEAAAIVDTATAKGASTDAAFDRLASSLGSDGLDILYDLLARSQRSAEPLGRTTKAGSKARTILARPEVLSRATPAMRVAYDLRRSTCVQRLTLFARAAKEGDDRALEILRSMQSPTCTRKDPCCLEKNRLLELAITDIQARLRQ